MMTVMLTQAPLPLLPAGATEIAPGVGVVTSADGGGVVWGHGLVTFCWDGGGEAGGGGGAGQLGGGGRGGEGPGAGEPVREEEQGDGGGGEGVGVRPEPGSRDAGRALARFGVLGEGAAPVFTPGARYPLAGLLLAMPALEQAGLLTCARAVYGRMRNGFYGLQAMLILLVFLALLREPRAEGATRISPAALGRVLGLDRAPEVKTIRRKLGELAGAGRAAELQMALARHHAAARPDTLGFCYTDGHTRAYFGKRDVQKMHVARLKFPGPGTEETWVTGSAGDPLLVVMAQPSSSLASQIRDLLPELRDLAGEAEVTLCFDRGGWSPELFADIIDARFHLLTYRKNEAGKDAPALTADAFKTAIWTGDDGRSHDYDLAEAAVDLVISDGRHKGRLLSLRQGPRRTPLPRR